MGSEQTRRNRYGPPTNINFDLSTIDAEQTPAERPTSSNLNSFLSLAPSSNSGGSSLGSLSVPPSPYSAESSLLGWSAAPSPTPSSPAFYYTPESRYLYSQEVGAGIATDSSLTEGFPITVTAPSPEDVPTLTAPMSQHQQLVRAQLPTEVSPVAQGSLSKFDYHWPSRHAAVDADDDGQLWDFGAARGAQSSYSGRSSPDAHGTNNSNLEGISSVPHDWGSSDRTTHVACPIINPTYSTFLGPAIRARAHSNFLREPAGSNGALGVGSAAHSPSRDHSWFGNEMDPSPAVAHEMPLEDRDIGRDVFKLEVASQKSKLKSAGRRRTEAKFKCPLPGCSDTFTKQHNLKSERALSCMSEVLTVGWDCLRSSPSAQQRPALLLQVVLAGLRSRERLQAARKEILQEASAHGSRHGPGLGRRKLQLRGHAGVCSPACDVTGANSCGRSSIALRRRDLGARASPFVAQRGERYNRPSVSGAEGSRCVPSISG